MTKANNPIYCLIRHKYLGIHHECSCYISITKPYDNEVRGVHLLEEGEGGSVTEEDEEISEVEVEDGEGSVIDGEGEGGSGRRQGPVGGPPVNLTSPM